MITGEFCDVQSLGYTPETNIILYVNSTQKIFLKDYKIRILDPKIRDLV